MLCIVSSTHDIFSVFWWNSFQSNLHKPWKFWLFQDFYFLSFVWREDDVNWYLQNVDSFSLHIASRPSMTFLSFLTWLIVHNLFMIGKVKWQSQASSGFSATCIMQLSDGKKERTIDVVPRQLQFTYCISTKHDFLELFNMTHCS